MAAPEPFRAWDSQGQCPDGIGEWNRQTHVSEIEHRGVDGHEQVVLQQWVGTGAVQWRIHRRQRPRARRTASRGNCADANFEWIGDGDHQTEEEEPDSAHDRQGRRAKRVRGTAISDSHRPCEAGEDQPPEDDGAFERCPGRGHVEWEWGSGGVMIGDVGQAEVVGEEADLHCRHRCDGTAQKQSAWCNQVPGPPSCY